MIVAPLKDKAGKNAPIQVKNTLWDTTERRLKLKATITEAGKTVRSEVFEITPAKDEHKFFKTNGAKQAPQ